MDSPEGNWIPRGQREFDFKTKMDFEKGIERTIEWYQKYITDSYK